MLVKKRRACSLCREFGHTRRTCPRGGANISIPVHGMVDPQPITPKVVRVQLSSVSQSSPHVVDLRGGGRTELWKKEIAVYKEPQVPLYERRVIPTEAAATVSTGRQPRESVWQVITKSLGEYHSVWHEFMAYRPRLFRLMPLVPVRVMAGVMLCLILIGSVPFPVWGYYQRWRESSGVLVEESTNGFLALQASTVAALQSNIPEATGRLQEALSAFGEARSIIEQDYHLLFGIIEHVPIVGTRVASRQHLLQAGHHLALGNTYLLKGVDEATRTQAALSATSRLDIIRTHLTSAIPQYKQALEELSQVDSGALPPAYQEPFVEFKLLFTALVRDMQNLVDLSGAFREAFGHAQLRRYLVVFQNPNELRATGGFMGSFAVIDVQKGKLVGVEVPEGGTYDVQGQTPCIVPPLPLQLVNNRWYLHDANWFPDFPQSAQKIASFYQMSRGVTVDGVIAVNASVLERMLRVIGPVHLPNRDVTLTATDAVSILQHAVERGAEDPNRPKAIIGDALEQVLNELSSLEHVDVIRLLLELDEALKEREIQLFVTDPAVEATFARLGWTGALSPVLDNQDYLMVVASNIGGEKTDAVIDQTIEHEAVVDTEGMITDTVTIRRTHTGTPGVPAVGVPNISYMRLYVPQGATLLDAGGFSFPAEESFLVPAEGCQRDADIEAMAHAERYHRGTGVHITDEGDKTVFGHWVTTQPGEMSEMYFTYQLPFSVFKKSAVATASGTWMSKLVGLSERPVSPYRLFVQKQSGSRSQLHTRVIYPATEGWLPVWRSRPDIDLARNGGVFESLLEEDTTIGILMEQMKDQ